MDKYVCIICGYIYDPAEGDPETGLAPGTPFEDIPDDWTCPACGVGKEHFEKYYGQKARRTFGPARAGPKCPRGLSRSDWGINTILAKENPNSFARILDFRGIWAISHQSSHPRRKTSHFFCKDYHPAGYFVCNSPHFKQSPQDATQRKLRKTLRRGTELRSRLPFPLQGLLPRQRLCP